MPSRAGPLAFPSEPPELSPEQERELIGRMRMGDERAFERIFVTYFAALCNFVRSHMRTPDEAEELVQEVFLRIWRQRAQWSPSSVRAYLFGAVRNAAINFQRHDHVIARFEAVTTRDELAPGLGQPPKPPDAEVQVGELASALRAAVQALPERQRQVVILRWEHHLSQAEIAEALGVSVRTVETQWARAMASLRTRLGSFRR